MRVCDVVKNSVWYDPRVRKQLWEYFDRGIDTVCVGIMDARHNPAEVEKLPCNVRLAEVEGGTGRRKTVFGKILREIRSNRALCREMVATGADLIHANDLNALIPAYFASKKLKCRLIYDTHEIFVENPWVAGNPLSKFVWTFFERRLIHKVDLVVCVSRAAGEYLSKKYQIPAPMVVTNSIRACEIIADVPEKNEPKEVLNHGQFYEGRGYETMIRTAPLLTDLPDVKFVVRGLGPKEAELKKLAAEVNAPNFRLDPPVRVNELIPEASKAWLGVAITEPISINFELSVSNKLFEYAAAGLPVLMSDIPEHRYLNEQYRFGLILEDNTPEAIATAVKRFYADSEFYKQCAENARKMSGELCWEKSFSKLICVEKELCGA